MRTGDKVKWRNREYLLVHKFEYSNEWLIKPTTDHNVYLVEEKQLTPIEDTLVPFQFMQSTDLFHDLGLCFGCNQALYPGHDGMPYCVVSSSYQAKEVKTRIGEEVTREDLTPGWYFVPDFNKNSPHTEVGDKHKYGLFDGEAFWFVFGDTDIVKQNATHRHYYKIEVME